MSQLEKLIQLFLSHPVEVRFEEVRANGSHHTFRHEDGRIQVVPKKEGQKVKGIYIKQIVKLLRLEE